MVVPVEWLATRPLDQAFREEGLFWSRNTVCKLRGTHTIETVEAAFGLSESNQLAGGAAQPMGLIGEP